MRKLSFFNHVSLDGYFTDANNDMSWAHGDPNDAEFTAFTESNAKSGGMLVFGRITYDMMASFWPTPMAEQMMPVVAERMNNLPKIVFSRTLNAAAWNNTQLVKTDPAEAIRRLKAEPGPDMVIFGSGSIVTQVAEANLFDEYQVMVSPVILGKGRSLFAGVTARRKLKLARTRTFGNGKVFVCYEPVA